MYCASCEVRTEFICYVEGSRPPVWSSGQSFWLLIQRSWFDSRRYQILWVVVVLERGPLVSTIEELLERKSSGSGLESREYGRRVPLRWPRGTLYPQELALTSPTSGGSVGIVRSRTQATEFFSEAFLGGKYWYRHPLRVSEFHTIRSNTDNGMARGNEGNRRNCAGGVSKAPGRGFERIESWYLFLWP
jgi:hypothetical protein